MGGGRRRVCYGGGRLCPAQGRASLCGQRVARWSGRSPGQRASVPPLLPSTDKANNSGLLWASAALALWDVAAYCSAGPTSPRGEGRLGEQFKLKVKYVEESSFSWENRLWTSQQRHCRVSSFDSHLTKWSPAFNIGFKRLMSSTCVQKKLHFVFDIKPNVFKEH